MKRAMALPAAVAWACTLASGANALCSSAPVAQEYREADLVVRARLSSELNTWNDEPSSEYKVQWGGGDPVVLYGLHVETAYKGLPLGHIDFFEERNSGAFYLDPDKDYLLFLNRVGPDDSRPHAAQGSYYVRYACGQSKLWAQVNPDDLAVVRRLSGHE